MLLRSRGVGLVFAVLWQVSGVLLVDMAVLILGAAMHLWSRGGAGGLVAE